MNDGIDALLDRLRTTRAEGNLGRLEADVRTRIDRRKRQDAFGGMTLQVQVAVTCVALMLGLLVAEFAGNGFMPMPLNSELVVLSDDGTLAPSVRLEGGT